MKLKNNYLYFSVSAVIILAVFFILSRGDKPMTEDTSYLSPMPSEALSTPTPTPTPTPVPKNVKPTPTLVFKVAPPTYQQLTERMYDEGTWFALNEDCTQIVPSNVTYRNNTEIMLDNTASKERHILKIGGREYLLEAGEWFLTVLSSPTLPVAWPIYCGTMELGRIDLVQ